MSSFVSCVMSLRYFPCAAIFFSASVVTGVPPTPQIPDGTSSMMTQVTDRNPSPSTETIASVTFRISSPFCSAVRNPLSPFNSASGRISFFPPLSYR